MKRINFYQRIFNQRALMEPIFSFNKKLSLQASSYNKEYTLLLSELQSFKSLLFIVQSKWSLFLTLYYYTNYQQTICLWYCLTITHNFDLLEFTSSYFARETTNNYLIMLPAYIGTEKSAKCYFNHPSPCPPSTTWKLVGGGGGYKFFSVFELGLWPYFFKFEITNINWICATPLVHWGIFCFLLLGCSLFFIYLENRWKNNQAKWCNLFNLMWWPKLVFCTRFDKILWKYVLLFVCGISLMNPNRFQVPKSSPENGDKKDTN